MQYDNNLVYQNYVYPYGFVPQYPCYWYVPYDNTAAMRVELKELRERVARLEKQK